VSILLVSIQNDTLASHNVIEMQGWAKGNNLWSQGCYLTQ